MTMTQAEQLKERLDKNMADFEASIMALDKKTIISKARKIAAMEDAHFEMTTNCDFDESEAKYLLLFQNPLEHVADQWASRLDDMGVDFDMALYEFFMRDENTAEYPLMSDLKKTDADTDGPEDNLIHMLLLKIVEMAEELLASSGYEPDLEDDYEIDLEDDGE